MNKLLERKDINNNDKWAIETIYKSDDEFEKDFLKAQKELEKYKKYVKKFLDSKEDFKDLFLYSEKYERLTEKLSLYASMKQDEDTRVSKYQEMGGKLELFFTKYSEIDSEIVPRMLKFDEKKLKDYINQEELKDYKFFFERILEYKKHSLTEEQEKLISTLSPIINNGGEVAYYLMNADMKFGKIKDRNGKDIELNDSNYLELLESDSREERKNAFEKYHKVYGRVNNTLASTYYETVKADDITAKLRKYKNTLNSFMEGSKIPEEVYTNLIDTVHKNLDTCYKYFEVKRKLLGLKDFHIYDNFAKVVKKVSKKYTFDEAKDIVLDALSVYGNEYIKVLNRAFNERWIDKYPNVGKRSGAYSTGNYESYPFVLMNFTGTYEDVSTIAHELGHSMHTYFSNKYNKEVNSHYPIFLAEIASTTNELLLSHYMYNKAKTKEEKISILNERLNLYKSTIYRQTMFAEFELIAHKEVEKGNVLTADLLNKTYYDLNKLYYGDKVVVDECSKYEWSRIPHFYSPFYVYKYATSLSIASYIADNIINNTPNFKDKYIEFLKSGGRDYPLDILKIIDIDLSDTTVFENALNTFKKDLNTFEELTKEE
ncbi:MAG: oligoendopeptidase F [Bacilli bacterium]|nr:oligoendopeptidase F [Bacilli bacterium]